MKNTIFIFSIFMASLAFANEDEVSDDATPNNTETSEEAANSEEKTSDWYDDMTTAELVDITFTPI